MEIKRNIFRKKGVFFSGDALFAVIILFMVLIFIVPERSVVRHETEVHRDILDSLATLRVGDVNTPFVDGLIATGVITDMGKSLLLQIGEIYVTDPDTAKLLAIDTLQNINISENFGIWYGDTLIFSKNKTSVENATDVEAARQILSGVSNVNGSVSAFSARAFLVSDQLQNYYYFGGYVGDGDISILAPYSGTIASAELEIAISDSFDLIINGVNIGNYPGGVDDFTPVNVPILGADLSNFNSGNNVVELKSDSNVLHVAGGFLKITYDADVMFNQSIRYRFPGIDGLVNLYDGFYVPGQLQELNIFLRLNSTISRAFLTIGNVTVYNGTTIDEDDIYLNHSDLMTILDYSQLSERTVPLRLGLENVSITGIDTDIDVYSVTDLSGSMDNNCNPSSCEYSCGACSGACGICDAKAGNNVLMDIILNNTSNRMGLVGYETEARDDDYHKLSVDRSSMEEVILNEWDAVGSTCICCGINRAIYGFQDDIGSPVGNTKLFYDLNGDVIDSSGNGNDGTIYGDPTYIAGIEGNAMAFNGDDYVDAGNVEMGDRGTVAFWFRLNNNFDSSSGISQGMWSRYRANNENSVIALKGSDYYSGDGGAGTIQTKMEGPGAGNTYLASTTNSWTSGTWYHVAYTWGGRITRIYINGVLENTATRSRGLGYVANDEFGRGRFDTYNLDEDRYFDGDLDDIRMFGSMLNETEIMDLANLGSTCGNGMVEPGEICDGNNASCGVGYLGRQECNPTCDGFEACEDSGRFGSMIVMSDGYANKRCDEQNTGSNSGDAIQAACDAYNDFGITVYSIGFGSSVDQQTLIDIAQCGNGTFALASTANLSDVYRQIANEIITNYVEQTLILSGNLYTSLSEESYLEFSYDKMSVPTGLVITLENDFDDTYSGMFNVPTDSTVLETRVTSYSGPRWTDHVSIDGDSVYDLSGYGSNYVSLGDPFNVNIPNSQVSSGFHQVNVTTGSDPTISLEGSDSNKIISTIVRNASTFSELLPTVEGCNWHILFEDDSTLDLTLPASYTGGADCYYDDIVFGNTDLQIGLDGGNDAYKVAILDLFKLMDLDSDGRIDYIFTLGDLEITLDEVSGIPWTWSSEVQALRWV